MCVHFLASYCQHVAHMVAYNDYRSVFHAEYTEQAFDDTHLKDTTF